MTLSPCRTLQNVIQTQKCVLCREYAKPNRCVFKCFAKVSKPKEEDLKSTGKAFQLLGPATAKDLKPQSVRWLGTTMSPWAADLKADRPGTKEVYNSTDSSLNSKIRSHSSSGAATNHASTSVQTWSYTVCMWCAAGMEANANPSGQV